MHRLLLRDEKANASEAFHSARAEASALDASAARAAALNAQVTTRASTLHMFRMCWSVICETWYPSLLRSMTARQVTELEDAILRMDAEADELVASRAPLEAQRQQLMQCGC